MEAVKIENIPIFENKGETVGARIYYKGGRIVRGTWYKEDTGPEAQEKRIQRRESKNTPDRIETTATRLVCQTGNIEKDNIYNYLINKIQKLKEATK